MAKHYSTRDFFRNTPNALLARYFAAREVLQDFDFAAIKETKIDALFEAWLAVSEAQRAKMEVDLREIGDMSNEKGVKAIIDEAEYHLSEDGVHETFVAMLMALPGHHERAMTTFLDHPALWKGATRLYHADTLSHWRKRKNLPKEKAATGPADIEALSAAIKDYYQHTEGRAKHCRVEPYRRGELEYFFAFPEDYAQNSPEWEGDELALQSRHPPFEIVFVWDAKDGRLELHLPGDRKTAEAMQAIFAETILKCEELPEDPADRRVYDLFPLRRKEFSFTWDAASGIEHVAVNKLRLSLGKDRKITLEANPKHDPKAVYALLEKLTPSLPRHEYQISQVGLTASVKVDATAPAKTVPFTISWPSSCSLKHDQIGLKLRAMLEASGIEPKEPAGDSTPDNAVSPAPTL
jgi:hypothetical protein